jgi:hypothetical protein
MTSPKYPDSLTQRRGNLSRLNYLIASKAPNVLGMSGGPRLAG